MKDHCMTCGEECLSYEPHECTLLVNKLRKDLKTAESKLAKARDALNVGLKAIKNSNADTSAQDFINCCLKELEE